MINLEDIKNVTEKKYSRSSGAGGQNVNKVETKVQLKFDIQRSSLTNVQKERLLNAYPDGYIQVYNQETRQQHRNEELAFDHLNKIIEDNIVAPSVRKKTKAPFQTKGGKLKKLLKDKWLKYKRRLIDI